MNNKLIIFGILIISCLGVQSTQKKTKGLRMKFDVVTQSFEKISQESSRLVITELLADLLKQATPTEAQIITYFALGELRPSYKGTQFNIAEKTFKKIAADLLDVSVEHINDAMKKQGDIGAVIAQGTWHAQHALTVEEVYKELDAFEAIHGVGSQEERAAFLVRVFKHMSPASAGLLTRIITGKLRLGFSDMTMIDAFSWMLVGNKSLRAEIEHAYNVCADIGHIAYLAKKEGIEGIKNVKVIVGIPIRPAAAERLPTAEDIVNKLGTCIAQPKLDGFRLQVHIDNTHAHPKIHFFSRNLIDMSEMFPDLVKALAKLKVKNCIFEGEAIAYDEQTGSFLPFQETVKRKRKHDIDTVAGEFPLKLFVFDILYLNGESLMNKDHHHRRLIAEEMLAPLHSSHVYLIEERTIHTAHELEEYFYETVGEGLEGLVVKKDRAHYQPGKRNFNWIKLKRQEEGHLEDTLDTVVLGYYYGKGKRAKFGIGAFLVGVYNKRKDAFETVAKIGTGLSDDGWRELKKKCDALHVAQQPRNVVCAKELRPDVWVAPEFIVMVRADEITQSPLHSAYKTDDHLGLALRFPRIMGYRPDKSAHETTTVQELHSLFMHQRTKSVKTAKSE